MPSRITYTEACSNFDKIYEEAISTRNAIVVSREGSESVSLIPTAELDSLMETVSVVRNGTPEASHCGMKASGMEGIRVFDKANSSLVE